MPDLFRPQMGAPDDIPLVWGYIDRLDELLKAMKDVDALLADPAGHPLDAINQARARIKEANA